MNSVIYYGGFGLAIALFLAAAAMFFVFRIPEVINYLRKTSRKGLVDAAVVNTGKMQSVQPRKSQIFTESENSTKLLDYVQATAILNAEQTEVLNEPIVGEEKQSDATEILS